MGPEQLTRLCDDGCVTIDCYLSHEATAALRASAEDASIMPNEEAAALRVKRGTVFARRNLLSAPFVQALVATRAIRWLVDAAAPDAVPVRAILFDKTGAANWTVPWHQDRSIAVRERRDVEGFGPWSCKAGIVHVQPPVGLLRSMVTLRISLDACGEDNGPLRVIAGTHCEILPHDAVEHAVMRGPESLCTTAAGGIVVMRPLVLHASSPARCVSHRRVLHIEFGPRDLPGGLEWARA